MAISIRVYSKPLLNCALIRLESDGVAVRILTGCGLARGVAVNDVEVTTALESLIQDLSADEAILVVAVSHTGRSLMAGFASSLWDGVNISHVWLPWYESASDAATDARTIVSTRALAMMYALEAASARGATELALNAVDSVIRDEAAIDRLQGGNNGSASVQYVERRSRTQAEGGGAAATDQVLLRDASVTTFEQERPASDIGDMTSVGSSGPIFDPSFTLTQRHYRSRNDRASAPNQMNLRTLGRLGALARNQPVVSALQLQQSHHTEGYGFLIGLGNHSVAVESERPVLGGNSMVPLIAAIRPARSKLVAFVGACAVDDPRAHFPFLDVVAWDGALEFLPAPVMAWNERRGDQWMEVRSQ